MSNKRLRVYADHEIGNYGYEEKEWYRPQIRQDAFLKRIKQKGLEKRIDIVSAPMAKDEDILLFHTKEHLRFVREKCATGVGNLDGGPTHARAHIERAATHVVGAVINATRSILSGEITKAFVPIAGFHHAHANQVRMYCIYNDCCIAIKEALANLKGNVAYIDIDVHHGDGVYDAFAREPRVIIADVHENRRTLFPYSPEEPKDGFYSGQPMHDGEGPARRTKLNINLEPYTDDEKYLDIFNSVESFVSKKKPEFIVLQAGLDAMDGDPLANQKLSVKGIKALTRRVMDLAENHASGRLLVLGGGGYNMKNCGEGWTAVVEALIER